METTEIRIEDLRPAEGATKKRKRVGRGRASGHGKTSTRGHNGEGQRSGCSRKIGFEGGQMPGYRKTPKLDGFRSLSRIVFAEINIAKIADMKEDEIDLDVLKAKGLYGKKYDELRILGNGELKRKVTVKARHFTKSAKEKIEAAGGKALIV
ncbi:MAG: 50S ribosomal protein L15 [Candidatus Melainabacteria bacterium GWA2_34_9]|nr:MAG: 50S ribosomal protein L15 [Candidatus Melainabacteria bacterium GWA2_34_9]